MGRSEKTVELIPQVPLAPRVVGPGRRERSYITRLENLQQRLAGATREQVQAQRELETSVRLERGCQRLIDRMEVSWSEDRGRLDEAQRQQKRLILSMGALQRENELLRERLELAAAPVERLGAGPAVEAAEQSPPAPSQRARRRPARAPRRGLFARLFASTSER